MQTVTQDPTKAKAPTSASKSNDDYVRGGKQKAVYTKADVLEWPCPLCGSSSENRIKTERGVLNVVSCQACDLIRINPRLKHPDEVYRGDSKIYTEEFSKVVSGEAPHHRDELYKRDLDLIAGYKPTGHFLDIGTNTGSFLRLARNRGWTLTGVEPSPQLGSLAREWWGLNIIEGFVEKVELPKNHFDVVTMTDVFEHVVNPKEVLGAVRQAMKPDGLLFIKVPNAYFNILKYKIRSMMGKTNTDDFDSYEHVLHYTDETLQKMLRASGFEPFKTTVEPPVQIPVWHQRVGHYYQHKSPFHHSWKTYSARNALYWGSLVESAVFRRVGWLAPNIGCFARPAKN